MVVLSVESGEVASHREVVIGESGGGTALERGGSTRKASVCMP